MGKRTEPFVEDRIFPIPLRPDVTVRIQDIPHDLTPKEAEKIVSVIQALTKENPHD